MSNSVFQTLVTTPAFNRGRSAAKTDMLRVQGSVTPYGPMLDTQGSEFRAGYLHEVDEFDILPEDIQKNVLSSWERERTVKEA